MLKVSASVVIYNPNIEKLSNCIESVFNSQMISKLWIIDNSKASNDSRIVSNSKIEYIFNNSNLGYGKAHNIAIKKSIDCGYHYHLVLNPDIYFEPDIINKIITFINSNPDVGQLMPKIVYPDGNMQHLCKLLPTPFDLIRRRFLPNIGILKKLNDKYELKFTNYDKIMNVPYLSGCFMFFRTTALKEVGLFDEDFFMYLEDTDITRRIHEKYRTIYFPEVSVCHHYEKGSYKSLKLLRYHLVSAFKYFSKWGFFFDKRRKIFNKRVIKSYFIDN